jgi:hypothetical protein
MTTVLLHTHSTKINKMGVLYARSSKSFVNVLRQAVYILQCI